MKQLAIIISIIILSGCVNQKVNFKDEEEKITKCWVDWAKKAVTGEAELGAYYFADSVMIVAQGQPTIKGKKEFERSFPAFAKTPGLKVNWGPRPNIIDFSKDGSMAYSLDTQELSMPDATGNTTTLINQVLHIWKKQSNGDWRVSFLMAYPKK